VTINIGGAASADEMRARARALHELRQVGYDRNAAEVLADVAGLLDAVAVKAVEA
jgi:hypothetical protein